MAPTEGKVASLNGSGAATAVPHISETMFYRSRARCSV